jgi:hypothetical protein
MNKKQNQKRYFLMRYKEKNNDEIYHDIVMAKNFTEAELKLKKNSNPGSAVTFI